MGHQPIKVALEQALAEPVRHAVREACGCAFFIGTQDPAHSLFAQVIGLIGLAQHRKLAAAGAAVILKLRRFLKQDVLMFDRNRRHVETEHAPGLSRIIPGRAHHVLGNDVTLVGAHPPFARRRCASRP